MSDKARILIVEDEVIVGLVLGNTVRAMGHEVVAIVGSGRKAVAIAKEEGVDLVLMDVRLSDDVDGIMAAEAINHGVPIVFHTAYVDKVTIDRAMSLNPIAVLQKPVGDHTLRSTIERGLSTRPR